MSGLGAQAAGYLLLVPDDHAMVSAELCPSKRFCLVDVRVKSSC